MNFAILNHHSPVLNIVVAWSLALSPVDFVLLPQSAVQAIPKLNVEAKVDMEVLGKAIISIEMYFQWISGSTGQGNNINRNVLSMDLCRAQGKTDYYLEMSQMVMMLGMVVIMVMMVGVVVLELMVIIVVVVMVMIELMAMIVLI